MKIWRQITEEFNCGSSSNHRELQTLKCKYENIKKISKKKFAEEKRQLYNTGGGKAEPVNITDVDEVIGDILQDQVTGLQSFFDCDTADLGKDIQQTSSSKISEKTDVAVAENSKTADIGNTSGINDDLNVVNKEKATTSTLNLPRKRKLTYKRDLCSDKWQQLADEKIKCVKDGKQLAKEKHELEMKLLQEEHELKKEESELRKEKLKLEIFALKELNNNKYNF